MLSTQRLFHLASNINLIQLRKRGPHSHPKRHGYLGMRKMGVEWRLTERSDLQHRRGRCNTEGVIEQVIHLTEILEYESEREGEKRHKYKVE